MNSIIFLVLRRMRAPLIVLIGAYAVALLGMVVVPGQDMDGNRWHMDFFHAFYFMSYMATTIGFGEIPYEFSAAQRLWATFSIYIGVIAWIYAIGTIITLLQDPLFKQTVTEGGFSRSVRRLHEPFYLICGYGDTGSLLVRALTQRNLRVVVIDLDQERINELSLTDHPVYVPGLCADANVPLHLLEAGLQHPLCRGIIALANVDRVNLQIAITSKLLNPDLPVICRSESHDLEANMASFGTDYIINPFDTFAEHLSMALRAPSLYLLHEWLAGVPNSPLVEPIYPPCGNWILCGYGRFGKAVNRLMERDGLPTVIIEADPAGTECYAGCVPGRGTEAETLLEADIEKAVGIVAGTNDDANNLSILITARTLNPKLFVVARQNKRANDPIFKAICAHLLMQPSEIIAHRILALVTNPLLGRFLEISQQCDNAWANEIISRMIGVVEDTVPEIWMVEIVPEEAPAVCNAIATGRDIRLQHLNQDPRERTEYLPCLALLMVRGTQEHLMPELTISLREGDKLLYCGKKGVVSRMAWTLQNLNTLSYVETGEARPDGLLWRWLAARRGEGAG